MQICFSQGAIWVAQALECLSPEYRKRISIIAIAPAAFMPLDAEASILHFVKKEDSIPYTLALNKERLSKKDSSIILVDQDSSMPHDPHGENYQHAIKPYIENYIQKGCIV